MEIKNLKPLLKRTLAVFMAVLMVMSTFATGLVFAEEGADVSPDVLTNGDCGFNDFWEDDDNVKWELYADGTLYIYGEGMMRDMYTPWFEYCNLNGISELDLVIDEGVTYVGVDTFSSYYIKSVELPESLEGIGELAFQTQVLKQ